MDGLDAFNQQAFGVLTSSKLLTALDISKEDPRIVERYGKGDPKNRDDGGPKLMEHFLAARRLVEAGARCVTVAFSRWIITAETSRRCGRTFRCSIRDLLRCSRICGSAAWRKTFRWWSGASLAARRRSTRTLAGIIGRGSRARFWRAAACATARSSARPIDSAEKPPNARSVSVKFRVALSQSRHRCGEDHDR